jgi:hypothetical protein
MRHSIIFLVFTLISCSESKNNAGKHTLDFGRFTIETPDSWNQIKEHIPYDSYVGRIAVDSVDTIYFDLGLHSNSLTEYVKINDGNSTLFYSKENLNNHIVKGDSLEIDSLVKSKFFWDIFDRRKTKIVTPKISGIGTTGIYIDSLWKEGGNIEKFNLYGTNLNPVTEKLLLESIKTLKFIQK